MARSTELDHAIAQLTLIQREAVQWQQGPLLLLAGPGSGKTRVLTCRIARLLGDAPEETFRVLGLTFTNKAADEMRTRINSFIPEQSSRLFLGTFHAFCAEILRQHGAHVGVKPDFRIYASDRDLSQIMDDAIKAAQARGENVKDRDTALLPVVHRLRAELIKPEDASQNVPEGEIQERIETVYRAYVEQLRAANALDFNSLIYKSWELFHRFPALAARYQTVYSHWCIDEFQDTNKSQFELIRAMAAPGFVDIFAVADDDQIIYQWNGASYQRFEEFRNIFKPTLIQLPTNYRCPAPIVRIANQLINHNTQRSQGKKPLEAVKVPEAGIRVIGILKAADENSEAAKLASLIKERYAASLGDVAILARNKKLLDLTNSALRSAGIRAAIVQRRDEFESAPFTWMHSCLRLANRPRDVRELRTVAFSFQKLTNVETDVEGILSRAEASHGNYFKQWLQEAQMAYSDQAGMLHESATFLLHGEDYKRFIGAALTWFDTPEVKSASEGDDVAQSLFADDRNAWNEIFPEIVTSIREDAPLEQFLQELDLRSKSPSPPPDCVNLMTIHAAKGKEFAHVILQGLAEDYIPSFQSKKRGDASPEMEEERRNCFVAITRAKETLVLSYATSYFGWTKSPSRFFSEMGFGKQVAS